MSTSELTERQFDCKFDSQNNKWSIQVSRECGFHLNPEKPLYVFVGNSGGVRHNDEEPVRRNSRIIEIRFCAENLVVEGLAFDYISKSKGLKFSGIDCRDSSIAVRHPDNPLGVVRIELVELSDFWNLAESVCKQSRDERNGTVMLNQAGALLRAIGRRASQYDAIFATEPGNPRRREFRFGNDL